jgi:hypothetical protein
VERSDTHPSVSTLMKRCDGFRFALPNPSYN